jgi:hypothetical protein
VPTANDGERHVPTAASEGGGALVEAAIVHLALFGANNQDSSVCRPVEEEDYFESSEED